MLNHGRNLDLDALLPDLACHLEEGERDAIATSIRRSARYRAFREKETVCLEGAAGECLWIVIEGMLEVYFGDRFIALRDPGSIVGEQALLEEGGVRKATLKTVTPTKLCQLDKAALNSPEGKAAWYKMIAIVLSKKLSQATVQRKKLSDKVSDSSELIGRFVCEYSLSKVQATIDGLADEYAQENALIWFSDLVGFSKQIAGFDVNVAAGVVRRFMKIQAEILAKHDGEIDKFMGDAVMAFWILGDDKLPLYSETAVNAALEAFNAVSSYASRSGVEIGLRVGLHCGKVIAGNFGTDSRIAHTLMGEHVNIAARYEQAKTFGDGTLIRPIRLSPDVFGALPQNLQRRFASSKTSEVKHGLEIEIHDGPVDIEENGNGLG